jgi:hypothetical protein
MVMVFSVHVDELLSVALETRTGHGMDALWLRFFFCRRLHPIALPPGNRI